MTRSALIVGLGSPHGDDQAGWLVIERLHQAGISHEQARAVRHSAELWNWCRPDQALTVCDASAGPGMPGEIRQWIWPLDFQPAAKPSGTHDMPLDLIFAMGVRLDCCPSTVEVWTIHGNSFTPAAEPSEEVRLAGRTLGDRLAGLFHRA